MRVRIVSYEDVNAWILGKFARNLNEELIKLGVDSDISNVSDPQADINHHIIYINYDYSKGSNLDTLMVTHIDDYRKFNLLKKQLQVAGMGICMSAPLMNDLIVGGISQEQLCYINAAHDGLMKPRPFAIGITSQVKPDGCKREHLVAELAHHISPEFFIFKIMGSGWENVIGQLEKKGFTVEYHSGFAYENYIKLMESIDYYLYTGQDEGSMGLIDALAAGVKTIVTPQGFHLDAPNGIVHPFNTLEELVEVFNTITQEKKRLMNAVSDWTWPDYAKKHLEIWQYLKEPKRNFSSRYRDGLNSLLRNLNGETTVKNNKSISYHTQLYRGALKRTWYKIKTGFKDYPTFRRKLISLIKNIVKWIFTE